MELKKINIMEKEPDFLPRPFLSEELEAKMYFRQVLTYQALFDI